MDSSVHGGYVVTTQTRCIMHGRPIAGREGVESEGGDMLGLRLILRPIVQLGEDGTLMEIGVQKPRLVY